MSFAARFVVLTEDSGASGWRPVVILVRAVCDQLVEGIRWERVEFQPREDMGPEALRSLGANRWKGADGTSHQRRVLLCRYIADRLSRAPEPFFVFFHVDADRTWSEGGPEVSENVAKFDRHVRVPVQQTLRGILQSRGRDAELEALMRRLHRVVPCYSLEAWLYQSTEVARERCLSRACRGAHAQIFESWARDRTVLDELHTPKEATNERGDRLHCLHDADKERLASAFPAREVRAAARSFAMTVEEIGDDGSLLNALIATGTPG